MPGVQPRLVQATTANQGTGSVNGDRQKTLTINIVSFIVMITKSVNYPFIKLTMPFGRIRSKKHIYIQFAKWVDYMHTNVQSNGKKSVVDTIP